jgi:hypothetical protein
MNSTPPKRGLGRGLEALLTEQQSATSVKINSANMKPPETSRTQAINELTLEAQTLKSLLEDMESWLETINVSNNH